MAKSSLEKTIEKQHREQKQMAEKQRREEKRAADKQAREERQRLEEERMRQRATTIVEGQPFVGDMRIIDGSAEEVFRIILSRYDNNENRLVSGNYDCIPEMHKSSLRLEFEKLCMYGVITSPRVWVNTMWQATITPQGLTYFDRKTKAEEKAANPAVYNSEIIRKQYDVFISHATKDKLNYVDSLYSTFRKLGVNIFYDSEVISWGDNWKKVILDGTNSSEFAVIVISRNFFGREWTERELQEFLLRQNTSGQKIVLPLLYDVSIDEFKEKYPELEEIQVAESKDYSKEEIAILFAKELIKRLKQ